jgi:membrane-associated protease RseP (regulator of RpoE activity)
VVGVGRISGEIAAAPGIAARDKISSYLGLLASLNLFLFIFNLVPLLPLDGGHIAGALFEGARRSVARLRGRAPTGPVDTARMLPLAYLVSVALLVMSLVVMVSDIVDPITLR